MTDRRWDVDGRAKPDILGMPPRPAQDGLVLPSQPSSGMVTPASPATPTALSEASDASSAQRRPLRTPALTAPAIAATASRVYGETAGQQGWQDRLAPQAQESSAAELEAALGLSPTPATEHPSTRHLTSVTAGSHAPASAQQQLGETGPQHGSTGRIVGSLSEQRETAAASGVEPGSATVSGGRQSREPTYSIATVTPREGGSALEGSGFNISSGHVTIKTRSAASLAPVGTTSTEAGQVVVMAPSPAPPAARADRQPLSRPRAHSGAKRQPASSSCSVSGGGVTRVVVPLRSTESPCPEAEPPLLAEPMEPANRPHSSSPAEPVEQILPASPGSADRRARDGVAAAVSAGYDGSVAVARDGAAGGPAELRLRDAPLLASPLARSSGTQRDVSQATTSSRDRTGVARGIGSVSGTYPTDEPETATAIATATTTASAAAHNGGGDDDQAEAASPVSPRFRAPTISSSIRRDRAIEARVKVQLQPATHRAAADTAAPRGNTSGRGRGSASGTAVAGGRGRATDSSTARTGRASASVGADTAPTAAAAAAQARSAYRAEGTAGTAAAATAVGAGRSGHDAVVIGGTTLPVSSRGRRPVTTPSSIDDVALPRSRASSRGTGRAASTSNRSSGRPHGTSTRRAVAVAEASAVDRELSVCAEAAAAAVRREQQRQARRQISADAMTATVAASLASRGESLRLEAEFHRRSAENHSVSMRHQGGAQRAPASQPTSRSGSRQASPQQRRTDRPASSSSQSVTASPPVVPRSNHGTAGQSPQHHHQQQRRVHQQSQQQQQQQQQQSSSSHGRRGGHGTHGAASSQTPGTAIRTAAVSRAVDARAADLASDLDALLLRVEGSAGAMEELVRGAEIDAGGAELDAGSVGGRSGTSEVVQPVYDEGGSADGPSGVNVGRIRTNHHHDEVGGKAATSGSAVWPSPDSPATSLPRPAPAPPRPTPRTSPLSRQSEGSAVMAESRASPPVRPMPSLAQITARPRRAKRGGVKPASHTTAAGHEPVTSKSRRAATSVTRSDPPDDHHRESSDQDDHQSGDDGEFDLTGRRLPRTPTSRQASRMTSPERFHRPITRAQLPASAAAVAAAGDAPSSCPPPPPQHHAQQASQLGQPIPAQGSVADAGTDLLPAGSIQRQGRQPITAVSKCEVGTQVDVTVAASTHTGDHALTEPAYVGRERATRAELAKAAQAELWCGSPLRKDVGGQSAVAVAVASDGRRTQLQTQQHEQPTRACGVAGRRLTSHQPTPSAKAPQSRLDRAGINRRSGSRHEDIKGSHSGTASTTHPDSSADRVRTTSASSTVGTLKDSITAALAGDTGPLQQEATGPMPRSSASGVVAPAPFGRRPHGETAGEPTKAAPANGSSRDASQRRHRAVSPAAELDHHRRPPSPRRRAQSRSAAAARAMRARGATPSTPLDRESVVEGSARRHVSAISSDTGTVTSSDGRVRHRQPAVSSLGGAAAGRIGGAATAAAAPSGAGSIVAAEAPAADKEGFASCLAAPASGVVAPSPPRRSTSHLAGSSSDPASHSQEVVADVPRPAGRAESMHPLCTTAPRRRSQREPGSRAREATPAANPAANPAATAHGTTSAAEVATARGGGALRARRSAASGAAPPASSSGSRTSAAGAHAGATTAHVAAPVASAPLLVLASKQADAPQQPHAARDAAPSRRQAIAKQDRSGGSSAASAADARTQQQAGLSPRQPPAPASGSVRSEASRGVSAQTASSRCVPPPAAPLQAPGGGIGSSRRADVLPASVLRAVDGATASARAAAEVRVRRSPAASSTDVHPAVMRASAAVAARAGPQGHQGVHAAPARQRLRPRSATAGAAARAPLRSGGATRLGGAVMISEFGVASVGAASRDARMSESELRA